MSQPVQRSAHPALGASCAEGADRAAPEEGEESTSPALPESEHLRRLLRLSLLPSCVSGREQRETLLEHAAQRLGFYDAQLQTELSGWVREAHEAWLADMGLVRGQRTPRYWWDEAIDPLAAPLLTARSTQGPCARPPQAGEGRYADAMRHGVATPVRRPGRREPRSD